MKIGNEQGKLHQEPANIRAEAAVAKVEAVADLLWAATHELDYDAVLWRGGGLGLHKLRDVQSRFHPPR